MYGSARDVICDPGRGALQTFLDYQRGWIAAITDISFECTPGAIFGLLGPNGAGKTTTLRILSTVLKPTGGRAIVAGHDVLDRSRRRCGRTSATCRPAPEFTTG